MPQLKGRVAKVAKYVFIQAIVTSAFFCTNTLLFMVYGIGLDSGGAEVNINSCVICWRVAKVAFHDVAYSCENA